jgi:predicted RNA-binding protein Jag
MEKLRKALKEALDFIKAEEEAGDEYINKFRTKIMNKLTKVLEETDINITVTAQLKPDRLIIRKKRVQKNRNH